MFRKTVRYTNEEILRIRAGLPETVTEAQRVDYPLDCAVRLEELPYHFTLNASLFFLPSSDKKFKTFNRSFRLGKAFEAFLKFIENDYFWTLKDIVARPKYFYISIWKGNYDYITLSFGTPNEIVTRMMDEDWKTMCLKQNDFNAATIPFRASMSYYHVFCKGKEKDANFISRDFKLSEILNIETTKQLFKKYNDSSFIRVEKITTQVLTPVGNEGTPGELETLRIPTEQYFAEMTDFSLRGIFEYWLPTQNPNTFEELSTTEILDMCRKSEAPTLKQLIPKEKIPYELHAQSYRFVSTEDYNEVIERGQKYKTIPEVQARLKKRLLWFTKSLEESDEIEEIDMEPSVDIGMLAHTTSWNKLARDDQILEDPDEMLGRLNEKIFNAVMELLQKEREKIIAETYSKRNEFISKYINLRMEVVKNRQRIANNCLYEKIQYEQHLLPQLPKEHPFWTKTEAEKTEFFSQRYKEAKWKLNKLFSQLNEIDVISTQKENIYCVKDTERFGDAGKKLLEILMEKKELDKEISIDPKIKLIDDQLVNLQIRKDRLFEDFVNSQATRTMRPYAVNSVLESFDELLCKKYAVIKKKAIDSFTCYSNFKFENAFDLLFLHFTGLLYETIQQQIYIIFLTCAPKLNSYALSGPGTGKSETHKIIKEESLPCVVDDWGSPPSEKYHTKTGVKDGWNLQLMDEADAALTMSSSKQDAKLRNQNNKFKTTMVERDVVDRYLEPIPDEKGGKGKRHKRARNSGDNRVGTRRYTRNNSCLSILSNNAIQKGSSTQSRLIVNSNITPHPDELNYLVGVIDVAKADPLFQVAKAEYRTMSRILQASVCLFYLRISTKNTPYSVISKDIVSIYASVMMKKFRELFKSMPLMVRTTIRLKIVTMNKAIERTVFSLFGYDNSVFCFDSVLNKVVWRTKKTPTNEKVPVSRNDIMNEMIARAYVLPQDLGPGISVLQCELRDAIEGKFISYFEKIFQISKFGLDSEMIGKDTILRYYNQVIRNDPRISFLKDRVKSKPGCGYFDTNVICIRFGCRETFLNILQGELNVEDDQVLGVLNGLLRSRVLITKHYHQVLDSTLTGTTTSFLAFDHDKDKEDNILPYFHMIPEGGSAKPFVFEDQSGTGKEYVLCFEVQGFSVFKKIINMDMMETFATIIQDQFTSKDNFLGLSFSDDSRFKHHSMKDYLRKLKGEELPDKIVFKNQLKKFDNTSVFPVDTAKEKQVLESERDLDVFTKFNRTIYRSSPEIVIDFPADHAIRFAHYVKLGFLDNPARIAELEENYFAIEKEAKAGRVKVKPVPIEQKLC